MEATLVGAVVGATIQVVLQNVLSAILEVNIGSDYENDLTQLNISLVMVQKYLSDSETSQVRGDTVHEWLKQLEDVAFEADEVLDEIKYESLRLQVKKQDHGLKKVRGSLTSVPTKIIFKVNMPGKIKDVINKLEKINKEARSYSLPTAMAVACQTSTLELITPNERETDSFSVEPYVIGREEYVFEIVEKLITAPSQENVNVISIVGMGGIGKTTVARTVFNDEKIGNYFGKNKIWLSVPFKFDVASLFKMILEALTGEEVKVLQKQVVLQKIRKLLVDEKKPYLLVLDDVWDEKKDKWDEFMTSLLTISNVNGNCIIVTTRNVNVNSHVRTLPTHQLRVLTDSQCWSIIKEKTFKGRNVSEEFERLGKCIAERCGGLPLAAKVIGGLLRGKSQEDWCNILENKLSDGDDDKIQKILKLSYDNLPSLPLKKCFAYCSIFPQDYSISRQELIELWMAEGFLQVGKGGDMEAVGSQNFNHLFQYSLFQDADIDIFGDIVYCKMHDLVHDLACTITKDMHQVRYLALESADRNEPIVISQGKVMSLRTLFFNGKTANKMFSNFKSLHVLKLTSKEITELPLAIEKLIHLRSLDISLTRVKLLPDSIGKLYHLQTLSIEQRHDPYLKKLPNTIINLVSLRHLHMSAVIELPPGVGKLISLRTLQHYKVRDDNGCRIGELGNLKNLKGELEIENLEMVKDKEEAELADLYGKPDILKLVLKWNESRDDVSQHKNVLEGLQPHPRLQSLEIIGYGFENLPLWTMRMAARNNIEGHWESFNSLVEIRLKGFTQCEELPTLGHLQRLRFLVLEYLHDVRSIGISFYGLENCSITKVAFPALEKLSLLRIPELTEWLGVEEAITVFPCLKYLEIVQCPKLKSVHSHLPSLEILRVDDVDANFFSTNFCSNTSSLHIIEIRSLSRLDSLPAELFMENKNLTQFAIRNCPKLMRLVPSSLGGGASLKKLIIWDCENLKELPNDLNTLCNLEVLYIIGCPGLKTIPYDLSRQSQGFTSLEYLGIRKCKGLTDLPIELLESCTSSLVSLRLHDLENLENLDTLIPFIGKMPRLLFLNLMQIPKLMIFPTEFCCLESLCTLGIGGFSESINAVSFNDQLSRILYKCSSLKYLVLYGKEHWDSLPNSIQNLTHLQKLLLGDFGIKDIPEWIGNLSSLQILVIRDCKRVRHLPAKETMKRLTRLYELEIRGCPLLKERCNPESTQHNSEWPKISHIRVVRIDRQQLPTK